MLVDSLNEAQLHINALGPVPEAVRHSCNDQHDSGGSVLVAGQPFIAELTVPELATFVRRLDRVSEFYPALQTDLQIQLDHLVITSLRSLVPLHDRICSWVDEQPAHVSNNRSSATVRIACSNPIPLGLVALGSMILAADAAIDILRRQSSPNVPSGRWVDHYRKHLRKALNRANDLSHKGIAKQQVKAEA